MKEKGLLILILLVAGLLRFYGFPEIPFMNDELSAWVRTGHRSFRELINTGVRPDGHPALVQVFLNYWRIIFGDSEGAFKFPFIIMGIVSVWLIFKIGKLWFNETAGLLSAAFVASMQYTVMYSQIARPYISGLFLSLSLVICWTQYFFRDNGQKRNRFLIWIILFSALCCYNHYFSGLFAIIVLLSGFLFIERHRRVEWMLCISSVALLFAPHIGITRDQLALGGVGAWLSKPDRYFFTNYLDYVSGFSWWVKGLVASLIVLSILFINHEWRRQNKLRALCLAWFLVPVITGFLYSRYRNPVLQYSVLIFSFPYLLLLLFSFFRHLKFLILLPLVTLILAAGMYNLIFEREHYRVFYQQPVEELVNESLKFAEAHPGKKTLIILNEPPKKMNYYLRGKSQDHGIISWQDVNPSSTIQTSELISKESPDYVICGNIPMNQLQVFRRFFPMIISVEKGFTYDWFVLGKATEDRREINEMSFSDSVNFNHPGRNWEVSQTQIHADSSGNYFFQLDSSAEYSCVYKQSLSEMMNHDIDWFLVDVMVDRVPQNPGASLVVSFGSDAEPLLWQEKPFELFIDSAETSGHLVYAIRFRDFDFMRKEKPPVKVYVWNKKRESFRIKSMKISVQKGNPWVYSLIEPIPSYADEHR